MKTPILVRSESLLETIRADLQTLTESQLVSGGDDIKSRIRDLMDRRAAPPPPPPPPLAPPPLAPPPLAPTVIPLHSIAARAPSASEHSLDIEDMCQQIYQRMSSLENNLSEMRDALATSTKPARPGRRPTLARAPTAPPASLRISDREAIAKSRMYKR